jgi:hypothetical protein
VLAALADVTGTRAVTAVVAAANVVTINARDSDLVVSFMCDTFWTAPAMTDRWQGAAALS